MESIKDNFDLLNATGALTVSGINDNMNARQLQAFNRHLVSFKRFFSLDDDVTGISGFYSAFGPEGEGHRYRFHFEYADPAKVGPVVEIKYADLLYWARNKKLLDFVHAKTLEKD